MPSQEEIAEKFWKAVKSDRTMMVGLPEVEGAMSQPMTAQLEDGNKRGPIWFFTARDTDLAFDLDGGAHRATAQFVAKDHDLFAAIDGQLFIDNDPAMIDRLWNPFAAAWFEGGKADPKLQLLRFEPEHAQIWLNDHSLLAGVKLLFGRDPKDAYQGKAANLRLS